MTTTTQKAMDVLMIICEFTDYKPDYVNERTAFAELFGSFLPLHRYLFEAMGIAEPFGADTHVTNDKPTLKDILVTESNNHLTVSLEKSKVVTIQMKVAWGRVTGCPYESMAERALRMVREQHPGVDPDSYSFRELFIPSNPSGGCTWDALANKGCGHPKYLPSPGACLAWYRNNDRFARMHELGHNLGLSHAGGDAGNGVWTEYGDKHVNMGNGYGMAVFSSADRYHMGWLADGHGEVLEWKSTDGAGIFVLSEAHRPPRQPGTEGVAVKIVCPSCRSKVPKHSQDIGGYLFIDYIQELLHWGWLTIRFSRDMSSITYRTQGTEEWAKLKKRGAFYEAEGISILFCHWDRKAQHATIAIGDNLTAARAKCLPLIYEVLSPFLDGPPGSYCARQDKGGKGKGKGGKGGPGEKAETDGKGGKGGKGDRDYNWQHQGATTWIR